MNAKNFDYKMKDNTITNYNSMESDIILMISGSREIKDHKSEFFDYLDDYVNKIGDWPILFVSGNAIGIDQMGEDWAKLNNIPVKLYKPNYSKYGIKAPIIRNQEMVNDSTHLIAFPVTSSRGTFHTVKCARKNNLNVTVRMSNDWL